MKKLILLIVSILGMVSIQAQNDFTSISKTLTDYIEGSTEGQPDRLKKAFYSDLNLYYVKEDQIKIWSGTDYIADTKAGKPTGEAGKIISIDFENNAAVAKVEISHPESKNIYIDYFMLLKVKDEWKIIHKMYTRRTSNKIQ